nr:hypothetical protein [Sinorhizobium numidicum]
MGKRKLAEAIRYALSRWDGLPRFIDDGLADVLSRIVNGHPNSQLDDLLPGLRLQARRPRPWPESAAYSSRIMTAVTWVADVTPITCAHSSRRGDDAVE